MGVTLRERINDDGTISYRLDIIFNGIRKIETLPFKSIAKPKRPDDREQKRENRRLAESMLEERKREIETQGLTDNKQKSKTLVLEWMQAYIDKYKKKDKRNMQGSKNRFAAFLNEEKIRGLQFRQLTEVQISDFWEYLKEQSTGEGASSYFNRFKKMMKRAYNEKLMIKNVAADVMARGGGESTKKEVLTLTEIKKLASTPTENKEVKRAFLFSCVTGLRFIDVNSLVWEDINLPERVLTVKQSKTGRDVSIPLNETAVTLLGKAGENLVFDLPTANGCNKTLKAWVKRAGINKAITWHNARHSFGTNLILHKHDIVTTSKLLGHTTLKHTQRYVDTAAELKRAGVDSLNFDL